MNSVFEKEISWLKSALRKKTRISFEVLKKLLCESVQILADIPGFVKKLTLPKIYYKVVSEMPVRAKQQKISKTTKPPF